MCRELSHPNHRRCPSSGGEQRRSRDRAVYAAQSARSSSSPVNETLTTITGTFNPPSLEQAAQELKEELHTFYHGLTGKNVGHSTLNENEVFDRSRVALKWTEMEKRVRSLGAQVENRAEEIVGFSAEEAALRNQLKVERIETDDVRKLQEEGIKLREERNQLEGERARSNRSDGTLTLKEKEELSKRIQIQADKIVAKENEITDLMVTKLKDLGYADANKDNFSRLVKEVKQGTDKETLADMKTLADARVTALNEIREMGGESIGANANSSKRVQKVMDEVSVYYPADWIRASNEAGNLKLKDTTGRAHYSQAAIQKIRQIDTDERLIRYGEEPEGEGWVRGVYTGTSVWANPIVDPEVVEKYSEKVGQESTEGYVRWFRQGYVTHRSWDGNDVQGPPPRGMKEYFATKEDGTKVRVFRKPRTRLVPGEVVSELTVDKDKPSHQWQETKGFDTAIHEFGHRAEHMNPVITQLEEVFLVRRTTGEDGQRDKLKSLYGTSREVSRPDSFASAYMGKEYRGQAYKEVLSTGMQGLFSGAFGNLAGTDGKTPDSDMRAFILGVLASA